MASGRSSLRSASLPSRWVDRSSRTVRILVAQSLVRLGQLSESLAELTAVPEDKRDAAVNYAIGRVYFGRKEWEKALQQFQAVAHDPTCRMQEAHLYKLKTMVQLQHTTDLAPAMEQCVRLASKSCVARECAAMLQ